MEVALEFFILRISLLFVTCYQVLSTNEQFLRFVPILPSEHIKYYYEHPSAFESIDIDATVSQQVRVRIIDHLNVPPILRLHCIVAALDSDSELLSAFLCRTLTPDGHEECIDPKDRDPSFDRIDFEANGNRTSGYTFSSKLPLDVQLVDGFYYCKYRNKNGQILSNYVEIQDIYNYHKHMINRSVKPTEFLPELSTNNFPMSLECGRSETIEQMPLWADLSFPSPFMWSFCEVSGPQSAQAAACMLRVRQARIRISDYFQNVVYPNGTLVLYKRTTTAWKPMGLVCFSHLNPNAIYSAYFGGNAESPKALSYDDRVNYVHSGINVLSPLKQSLKIRAGPQNGVQLRTNYQSNPLLTQYTWYKDGRRIPPEFPEPTEFVLNFPAIIERNHSGIYKLNINNHGNKVDFIFNVQVEGPPEVTRAPPAVIFVMERKNVSFVVEMNSFIYVALEVNGFQVYSSQFPSGVINGLSDSYPYLKDVRISPLRIVGTTVRYSASNLFFPSGNTVGPTHTVSLIGHNHYGVARVSTLINVLPHLIILSEARNYNCTDGCWNTQSHVFDCKIDPTPYSPAYVLQTWEVDGIDVSRMHKEDRRSKFLEHVGTELILHPVLDPKLATLFSNLKVTCRWRIFYPELFYSSQSTILDDTLHDPAMKIYDTRDDPVMNARLTAMLKLEVDSNVAASASLSWIAIVAIVLAIIIAIAILTTCIVIRTRGETYLLDREERALGNDPEKELREKEAFQTYERTEEPPLRGSRCSLNDDSAEIGSDADGELDDYNLDPGKFNEEGSFIGEYASDKHRGGTTNRLQQHMSVNYQP